MAENGNGYLTDSVLSVEAGVDAGFAPPLILPNQNSWAVNTTHRRGWATCRPGWVKRDLLFDLHPDIEGAAKIGRFQGAGSYISDNGTAYIAYSISGRVFTINLNSKYRVAEITPAGDPNMASRPHAWFQQAENWLVVQNAINPPILYNGAGSRRAGPEEVPIGGPMDYGKGRLWVARRGEFFGGDLVGSDPDYGRDSVIRFTENTYLNEGGGFAVEAGPITGLKFAANLDSALGAAALLISTADNVHAFDAPVDRDVWKDLQYPLMTYAAREFGSVNHESMVVMNGDVVYRSTDGARSLKFARRDFTEWGNSPISRQIDRAFEYDTEEWLFASSSINFDNRMLMTVAPQRDNTYGVYHRGLVALDYHLVSGMGRKLDPAWEGVWTGLRILHVVTVRQGKAKRAFILALGCNNELELWEISKGRQFDFDGTQDVPIQWTTELRGMAFGSPNRKKQLQGANIWVDKILGTASVRALYRADETPCWHPWASWSDCVDYTNCGKLEQCLSDPETLFQPVTNFRDQQRPRIGLPQPTAVADQQTGGFTRDGFFFQIRLECTGKFRLKIIEALARDIGQGPYGDMKNITCDTPSQGSCATQDCQGLECCDRDDYGYAIQPECESGGSGYQYPYPYPTPGDELPDWDPENPSQEPTPTEDCGLGTTASVITSQYAWGLIAENNPNTTLTAEDIAKAKCLLAAELAAAGYTAASNYRWVHYGTGGGFYAAIRKSTCDPYDGIDDYVFVGSQATALAVAVCIPV